MHWVKFIFYDFNGSSLKVNLASFVNKLDRVTLAKQLVCLPSMTTAVNHVKLNKLILKVK